MSSGPRPIRVVRRGDRWEVAGPGEIRLEDGTRVPVAGGLPPDLPWGYHQLHLHGSVDPLPLIVVPAACYWPDGLKTWGWAIQLYACRSAGSWGVGDLADLRRLAHWSAGLGAGLILVNPLNAVAPLIPQESSPYLPTSRMYRNPLYLRIEEVPGAAELGSSLEPLARLGRALNDRRLIDRDAAFRLKTEALERLWPLENAAPAAFEAYLRREGSLLHRFATFCALAEWHRSGWRDWPLDHRNPDSPGVRRFARDRRARVRFHAWLQWLCDEQLARAARELALVQDLPVGVGLDGADAWLWQDVLAQGVTVGAPPDAFNPAGQNWGFAPFDPDRLAAVGYAPIVHVLRAALRHARGIRIDHVLGLSRLFWIDQDAPPEAGRYVRYPLEDLLGIVALESHRAGAFVIGEDLGTVEPGLRERLAAARILSYRVLWFESEPPATLPYQAVATVTTHDLPTVAGLWTGADLETQRRLNLARDEAGVGLMRARLREWLSVPDDAPVPMVIAATTRLLAQAPSAVLLSSLEDACQVEERPNVPGTHRENPNWSLALPVPLEALTEAELPVAMATALRRHDRSAP